MPTGRQRAESKRVYGLAAVTNYGTIERDPNQGGWAILDWMKRSPADFKGAVELQFDSLMRTSYFPRVRAT